MKYLTKQDVKKYFPDPVLPPVPKATVPDKDPTADAIDRMAAVLAKQQAEQMQAMTQHMAMMRPAPIATSSQWRFDIKRNTEGFIKEIIAERGTR